MAPGVYDFTKAHDYDEDLVRHNLNLVKRPVTAHVIAPTLVKEIIKKEKPDFVSLNKIGLGEVSNINLKRVQMMKQQSSVMKRGQSVQNSASRRSELTRVSTEQASLMQ